MRVDLPDCQGRETAAGRQRLWSGTDLEQRDLDALDLLGAGDLLKGHLVQVPCTRCHEGTEIFDPQVLHPHRTLMPWAVVTHALVQVLLSATLKGAQSGAAWHNRAVSTDNVDVAS